MLRSAVLVLAILTFGTFMPFPRASTGQAAEIHTLDRAEIIWNERLVPTESISIDEDRLKQPGMWLSTIPEAIPQKGRGQASYKFLLPALPQGTYELKLGPLYSASEAWLIPLDDPSAAHPIRMGQLPGAEAKEIPFAPINVLSFLVKNERQRWILLINISNHSRFKGGIWDLPKVAVYPTLSNLQKQNQLLSFLASGAMLIMLFYQLMIFLRRTEDLSALALAAICLSIVMRNIGSENYFQVWVDQPTSTLFHDLAIKFEYIPIITAPLSCLVFLVTTFRKVHVPPWAFHALTSSGAALVGAIVIAPPRVMELMLPAFQFYDAFVVIYCLILIVQAVRLKEQGSTYTLLSMAVPLLLGILELYLYAVGKGVNITTFAAVIFVFMQSQVLARRFADAYHQAEHLSRALQTEVDQQTWKIRHIMRHVPQGIGTLDCNLLLGPVCSDSMKAFFPRTNINAETFDSLICNHLLIDESSRTLFPATLQMLIGEHYLTWSLNSHLLIKEARTRDNRMLAFEWHPILKDGLVDEVLVTVRDVSELIELRQRNLILDREFECYVAFSNKDRDHAFHAYLQLERLVDECREMAGASSIDENWSRRILINFHTMKGNARQLALKSLAAELHQDEQQIIGMSVTSPAGERVVTLNQIIQRLDESFERIRTVFERIHGSVTRPKSSYSLDEALRNQFDSLWNNHGLTDRESPALEIAGPLELLQGNFRDVFHEVWLHLLTNSFDHGLYPAGAETFERVHDKPRIVLRVEVRDEALVLSYSDNGRGLNPETLFERAIQLNLIDATHSMAPEKAAELIFKPGFSTRRELSATSGRGIGMDAVKTRLEAIGVKVHLQLTGPALESGFHHFQVIMQGNMDSSFPANSDKGRDHVQA